MSRCSAFGDADRDGNAEVIQAALGDAIWLMCEQILPPGSPKATVQAFDLPADLGLRTAGLVRRLDDEPETLRAIGQTL